MSETQSNSDLHKVEIYLVSCYSQEIDCSRHGMEQESHSGIQVVSHSSMILRILHLPKHSNMTHQHIHTHIASSMLENGRKMGLFLH